jgi:hypothetical protein
MGAAAGPDDTILNYIILDKQATPPAQLRFIRAHAVAFSFPSFCFLLRDCLSFAMVKFSLPTRDRDKSQFQAGSSFTPSFAGRLRSPSSPNVLRRLIAQDPANSSHPSALPLMTLRLSSPSFLDSVVHDGSSENPLYVIDTDDNITKVRRSDPKGFVNVSRVRWPTDFHKSSFRKNKGLTGVEVVFGKGHWKPADEFLGYSYGTLSR